MSVNVHPECVPALIAELTAQGIYGSPCKKTTNTTVYTQFYCPSPNAYISIFDSGKVRIQGKEQDELAIMVEEVANRVKARRINELRKLSDNN